MTLRLERIKASAQFRAGSFRNTSGKGPGLKGNPLPIMSEFFFGGGARRPRGVLPVSDPLPTWGTSVPDAGLRITWLGHSTMLIEVDGQHILTDPVFGERASPVSFSGPKRFHPVPATIDQLPPLDAVLLSHDHFDHLCAPSMKQLARLHVPIITSLGVGAHLEQMGVDPAVIFELDWQEQHTMPGGRLAFRATPAQHFSGRGLLDRNRTLWSSWVITTDRHRQFFSGDTGFTDEFSTIGEQYGPFDVVMLEIGAFHPAWGDIHLGPENAHRAFQLLNGKALLPVHWGTFDLALHPWDEPAEQLFELARKSDTTLLTPTLGKPFMPIQHEAPNPWWRTLSRREP